MVTRLQSDLCTSTAFIPCATAQSLHLSGITITRLPHSLSPKSLTRCHTGYWVSPISCQSIFATPSCVYNIKAKLTIRVMCIDPVLTPILRCFLFAPPLLRTVPEFLPFQNIQGSAGKEGKMGFNNRNSRFLTILADFSRTQLDSNTQNM